MINNSSAKNFQPEKIAITGANGYLGLALSNFLSLQGHSIIKLMRNPTSSDSIKFNLDSVSDSTDQLGDATILIHCAYSSDYKSYKELYSINFNGSKKLFELAKKSSLKKIIFISSIGAINKSESKYGKIKFELENLALKYGAIVIRPAFIVSNKPGGIYGKIVKLLRHNKFIPYFLSRIPFYVTYENELLNFIHLLINSQKNIESNIFSCFNKNSIDFSDFLKITSKNLKLNNIFIPISASVVLLLLKTIEVVKPDVKFSSDSFSGLIYGAEISDYPKSCITFDFSKFK
jgi:nucleoside-diphosphate-sugar epimerase